MKHSISIVLTLLFFSSVFSYGQKDLYITSGGEFLFQFSQTEENGQPLNDIMRFTLFFHAGNYLHYDFSKKAGLYSGLAVRNIGYIHQEVGEGQQIIKIKRRSYTLGVPLAMKIGNMDGMYLVFGGEYEWLFAYKEKRFEGNVKSKYVDWFSNRTLHFIPSVFAGVEFPMGFNIKVKYYLKNFMNNNYRAYDGTLPYENHDVRIIYVSLSMNLVRWHVGKPGGSEKKMEFFTRR
ncbi:MAG: hypothetical protein J7K46_09060 [Bacteroidales bacterium]|nr:hypothetical protein [Bacteroidales bacterium]